MAPDQNGWWECAFLSKKFVAVGSSALVTVGPADKSLGGLPVLAGRRQKVLLRINELIRECGRTPFRGIGKPEPLKVNYAGLEQADN